MAFTACAKVYREPHALEEAAKQNGRGEDEVNIRMQEGFDHSYYFISTFTPEHVAFHAKHLRAERHGRM